MTLPASLAANPLPDPMEAHDRRLVSHVRPPGWVNPRAKDRYHLVVIGAGTAGLVSAAGAAGLGATVAIVERHRMGGDCLNVGCVPSKGVIGAARAWAAARGARHDFHGPAVEGVGDFGAAMERMRRIRADLSPLDGASRFRDLGVDVFLGQGTFVGPDRVEVDSQVLRFRRAVIATGARAAAPPVPGLASVPYLTNESVFSLTELPRRLIVIGGGPIGCEMAQSFARFGSVVTLIDLAAQVLPREDADAASVVQDAMRKDGVQFSLDSEIRDVSQRGTEIVVRVQRAGREEEITGDQLLVAVGRAPNVEGMGLEAAGVRYGKGGVAVDDTFRTSNRRIFACGDVSSRLQFTHAADFQARAVVQNAFFFGRKQASRMVVPWATYTSPEIAHVGHTEASARAAGIAVQTIDVPMHDVDRARLDGRSEGFARVHVRAGKGTILGATIVAEHAGDLISEVTLAMTSGLGLGAIGATIHPYPTHAEVLRKAADAYNRTRLTPAVKSLFRGWFKLFS